MAHDPTHEGAPERHHRRCRAVLRLPERLPPERIEAGYQAILRLLLPQIREALAQAEPANDQAPADVDQAA